MTESPAVQRSARSSRTSGAGYVEQYARGAGEGRAGHRRRSGASLAVGGGRTDWSVRFEQAGLGDHRDAAAVVHAEQGVEVAADVPDAVLCRPARRRRTVYGSSRARRAVERELGVQATDGVRRDSSPWRRGIAAPAWCSEQSAPPSASRLQIW